MATGNGWKQWEAAWQARQRAAGGRRPAWDSTKDIAGHPLFQGNISRWIWRFSMYRLTPPARWFAILTFFFMVGGASSLDLQIFVPFTYALPLWLFALLLAVATPPRVSLQARHSERVCAGETVWVDLEVTSRSRFAVADLVVLPHRLPQAIDAVPVEGAVIPALAPGESARARLGLQCVRRGVYCLRGFRAESGFPFGLLRAYRVFAEDRPLLVYPQFHPLTRLQIPTGRRYQPGGVVLAANLGDSFEFIGNREYREGDNIRDIDWRATARLNIPIVREYREEYLLRVAVILDTCVPRAERTRRAPDFERAVSLCASVGDWMSRHEYVVDLFAAGQTLYHLTAGRSLAYLDQILDILACVEDSPAEPFAQIEPELLETLAQITTVVCVFLDWNEARHAFVSRLRQAGVGVKVFVVRDIAPTRDPAADAGLAGEVPVLSASDFAGGIQAL